MIGWHNAVAFVFQAEDGIRVAQESRGLGDVYKRQCVGRAAVEPATRPLRSATYASGTA